MKLETKFIGLKEINGVKWLYCELQENNNFEEIQNVLKNEKVKVVDLDYVKKKRSLTSNSYSWTLVNKIAIKLRTTDDEIYLQMLERYGTKEFMAGPTEAEYILKKSFKIVIPIKECVINDTKATTFKLIRGSSTYDQFEMNIYIEGVVSECKLLGIETLPPEEINRLIKLMGDK